ncbi:MAG: serine hydrolase [Lachnospiraceae bacterium]|nr:serine hydrolase [Lachnospiraceae bacterium]
MKKSFLKRILPVLGIMGLFLSATAFASAKDYGIRNYCIVYGENGNITYDSYGKGIDENSVFELGSNGKTVAAYIALKLTDEGKIGLDDTIAPYLDSNLLTNDERMNEITLRQLLCHTAGFSPSYEFGVDKKIYSDPGAEFRYSGVGYIYLQNVIENVSGMTFEQAAKHYVFEPLGMKNSTFEKTKTVTPYIRFSSVTLYAFAVFLLSFIVLFLIAVIVGLITKFRIYSLKTAFFVCFVLAGIINTTAILFILSKAAVPFFIYFAAAGLILFLTRKKNVLYYSVMPALTVLILILGFTLPGSLPVTNDLTARKTNCAYSLKSTGNDMGLFCAELMNEYADENSAVHDMFSPVVTVDDSLSWGLGIAIESDEGKETYWHSGINPGFQSLYALYPSVDRFIVVITDSDNGLDYAKERAKTFLDVNGRWDIPR